MYLKQVKAFIGDDTIPAKIINISKWNINETVAETYSKGSNIFCLGDAVHRHPPFNGLGSNTCIQDALNLAWKVAYVESGRASKSLLATYTLERQPVGHSVITRANDGFRDHFHVWQALGILPNSIAERRQILSELTSPSLAGQKRRAALQAAVLNTCHEFHGLGIEMNQTYRSPGVFLGDEKEPFELTGPAATEPILFHMRSTYPGRRLPHAWLNKRTPSHAPISTIDLAGKCAFSLFTGIGGEVWKDAAKRVAEELPGATPGAPPGAVARAAPGTEGETTGPKINVYSIGPSQDWEDVYYDWVRVRGVQDSGAVLVRPDGFVAWRWPSVIEDEEECVRKVGRVMRSVLGLV